MPFICNNAWRSSSLEKEETDPEEEEELELLDCLEDEELCADESFILRKCSKLLPWLCSNSSLERCKPIPRTSVGGMSND
jgi:hypothetical protein